jgi:WXXGXW repeat (2 copies)
VSSSKRRLFNAAALRCVVSLSGATLLGGCVAEVAAPPPPPPPVAYVAPAPAPAVGVTVEVAPPALPVYVQPACPVAGYLWTPGYWAWAPAGYYWVPGTWVQPPQFGVLWTPGYWGFVGGAYLWHAGYWGPHVGFYGGVNYGFGYVGVGYAGGHWAGNTFAYNQAVTNVNVSIVHNTYNETVINNVTVNRVSYNGGPGGTAAAPTPQERMAAREPHIPPTPLQQQHVRQAAANPALFAKANGGRPAIAATARPAVFNGPGVVHARGAEPVAHAQSLARTAPAANHNQARPNPNAHAKKAKPAGKKPPNKREDER